MKNQYTKHMLEIQRVIRYCGGYLPANRWAYKVSPSDWAQIAYELQLGQPIGFYTPAPRIDRIKIMGVDVIMDERLEEIVPVLKDYGSSG